MHDMSEAPFAMIVVALAGLFVFGAFIALPFVLASRTSRDEDSTKP